MSTQTIHILEGAKREPTLAELVEALGYDIHEARDRGELIHACRELQDGNPVVIDGLAARAAGPGGDSLLEELTEGGDTDVLVSIRDPEAREWIFEHGAADYIFEPFLPAELVQRMASLVGPPRAGSSPRVLLATEDEMVRGMLEPSFEKQGWTLLTTDSGKEALSITEAEEPDLVLIESGLRFCSAFEFLDQIADDEHVPAVVVLADGTTDADVVRAFDLGAADVVDQPYHPQVVFARARRLIDEHGGRS